jgi:hypothetical protein
MWRKLSAALIGAALIATPVLAVETVTAPATVPARIHSAPKVRMPAAIGSKSASTGTITAKKLAGNKKLVGTKVTKSKSAAKPRAARLAAKAHSAKAKATASHRRLATAKAKNTKKQRVSALLPKSKNIKAAEPVETTGSVAPRSVPAPGLY